MSMSDCLIQNGRFTHHSHVPQKAQRQGGMVTKTRGRGRMGSGQVATTDHGNCPVAHADALAADFQPGDAGTCLHGKRKPVSMPPRDAPLASLVRGTSCSTRTYTNKRHVENLGNSRSLMVAGHPLKARW